MIEIETPTLTRSKSSRFDPITIGPEKRVSLRHLLGLCDSSHATRLNNYGAFVGSPLACMTNQVTHADSIHALKRLPANCVDFVLTDPPYLVRYVDRAGRSVANDDNARWLLPAFSEVARVLKPNSYCVSFYGWSHAELFLEAWKKCGLRPIGHFVWSKPYASRTRHVKMRHEQAYLLAKGEPALPASPPSDVLPWEYTGNKLHPTQKPVKSLVPLVEAFSAKGGIVLDPFAGSGSTGAAARSCGRQFILIEKDASYHRAAVSRFVQPARSACKRPIV